MRNNLPSVHTLRALMWRGCKIDYKSGAKLARQVLECRTNEAVWELMDKHPEVWTKTSHWEHFHRPPALQDVKLEAISTLTQNCGVEFIPKGRNAKSPSIKYINTGDSYTMTLMWTRGRYVVGDWGSIVERGDYV